MCNIIYAVINHLVCQKFKAKLITQRGQTKQASNVRKETYMYMRKSSKGLRREGCFICIIMSEWGSGSWEWQEKHRGNLQGR